MPDTLEQRTTIGFPRDVTSSEAQKLFKHLCGNLNCIAKYAEETIVSIANGHTGEEERYTGKIAGSIIEFEPPLVSVDFSLYRNPGQWKESFDGIKFHTPPGYEIEEINPEELDLMDKIRGETGRYFVLNSGK